MSARLLIELCGLSQREAAEFLGVRLDTVKSWFRPNASIARPGVLEELRRLHRAQRRAAANQLRLMRDVIRQHGAPDEIEFALSSDDFEAQSKGWPCVGAERMSYALVAALSPVACKLVARGATLSSAAAADKFDQSKG